MKKLFSVLMFSILFASCGKNNSTAEALLNQFPVNGQGIMQGSNVQVVENLKLLFTQKAINTGITVGYSVDADEGSWSTSTFLSGFFTMSNLSNLKYNDYIVRSVSASAIAYDKITNVSSGSATYASGTYTETDKQNFINKVFPDLNNSQVQLQSLTARQSFIGGQTIVIYRIVMRKLVSSNWTDVTYEVSADLPLFANPLKASENYNTGLYRNVRMIGQNYLN